MNEIKTAFERFKMAHANAWILDAQACMTNTNPQSRIDAMTNAKEAEAKFVKLLNELLEVSK